MKSFLSGRPTAPISALKPLAETTGFKTVSTKPAAQLPSGASPRGGDAHQHLPSVECVKQGDKVTHLIVTCACGERIEINCLYAGPV